MQRGFIHYGMLQMTLNLKHNGALKLIPNCLTQSFGLAFFSIEFFFVLVLPSMDFSFPPAHSVKAKSVLTISIYFQLKSLEINNNPNKSNKIFCIDKL